MLLYSVRNQWRFHLVRILSWDHYFTQFLQQTEIMYVMWILKKYTADILVLYRFWAYFVYTNFHFCFLSLLELLQTIGVLLLPCFVEILNFNVFSLSFRISWNINWQQTILVRHTSTWIRIQETFCFLAVLLVHR